MAATNINRVVLTGNLTRDPELRSLPSGMSVCSLRIACNTRRKGQDGQWYFSVKAANHETVAQSEGYRRRIDAEKGLARLIG